MTIRTPSYRHHKPTNQAVVTLDGRDFYLGAYGSARSRAEYDRLVADWLANGRRLPVHDLTINELLLAYLSFADGYYRKDGKPTREISNIKDAVRLFRRLCGHTPAAKFGPLALESIRRAMVEAGLCRNEVNKRIGKIRRIFKWAASKEFIPASVFHGLQTVEGLKKGRSAARESRPVKPVADADVEAVLPYVSRQIRAMIAIQLHTGMRPGEVCQMRTCDLDTSGNAWSYSPQSHKTEHHGRDRRIFIGPRAQEVLRPWLRSEPTAYLFSPREASEERWAEQRRNRKSPKTPSQNARGRKVDPKRTPGEVYQARAYCHAIRNACKRAGVPIWHPNQLRHNAATRLRKEFGLDVARVILGHSSPSVTEIYAEVDREKAMSIMERVG